MEWQVIIIYIQTNVLIFVLLSQCCSCPCLILFFFLIWLSYCSSCFHWVWACTTQPRVWTHNYYATKFTSQCFNLFFVHNKHWTWSLKPNVQCSYCLPCCCCYAWLLLFFFFTVAAADLLLYLLMDPILYFYARSTEEALFNCLTLQCFSLSSIFYFIQQELVTTLFLSYMVSHALFIVSPPNYGFSILLQPEEGLESTMAEMLTTLDECKKC